MNDRLLAFYADDFTGATDALDSLTRNGVETVLFLEEITPRLLAQFPDADAVGVAGKSRSMAPEEMAAELAPHFERFLEIAPSVVHYKVCSTFDSSPDVGSIGRAIDVGMQTFDVPAVPVSVCVPQLGRYLAFGTLFAEEDGEVYRIDRHPTMKDHPVTPMTEANLLDHLGVQTDRQRGLVDLRQVSSGAIEDAYRERVDDGAEIVFLDGVDEDDLSTIGEFLWTEARRQAAPLFSVGSSGIGYALSTHWDGVGLLDADANVAASPTPVDQVVVVSGSASPVTDAQIAEALEAGFEGIRVRTADLVTDDAAAERRRVVEDAAAVLDDGRSPIIYTARGPDDPAIQETKTVADGVDSVPDPGTAIGVALGDILHDLLSRRQVPRICVAGGDTSGHVTSHLDVYALTKASELAPGSPLCRAWSRRSDVDGLTIALKGGQLGGDGFFERVRRAG